MPPKTLFARNLHHLKNQSGKTWVEIGQGLGHKTDRYVLTLAAGTYEPRQQTIRSLAAYFGVPESYFAEEHDG